MIYFCAVTIAYIPIRMVTMVRVRMISIWFILLLASVAEIARLIDFQHLLTLRGIRLRDFEKRLTSLSVIRRGFFKVS
jgi:hypothetical protein